MKTVVIALLAVAGALALLSNLYVPFFSVESFSEARTDDGSRKPETTKTEVQAAADTRPIVEHTPLPAQVKAIYMSACVAGTVNFRERLLSLIDETEINSVVIDIKDYSGAISFPPENPKWQPAWDHAVCGARDMREFLAAVHKRGIFVIGRITVFQDPFEALRSPHLAVKRADGVTNWKDGKGLSFMEVAGREYWDHLMGLVVDSYNIGFDELNFDYVRYPSDGNMSDISFPHTVGSKWPGDKQANLEAFFAYLNTAIDEETRFAKYKHNNTGRASSTPWTSADLFGMTTTNFDDLSIGQVQDRAAPYFDFIAPMVYPSHYPKNYLDLGDPNDHPYEVVFHAMKTGVKRMQASTTPMNGFLHERIGTTTPPVYKKPVYGPERLRTWIQDFDYGGDYDAADVRTQIQASYDAGVMSYMIWAPSNIYTKGALKGPTTTEVTAE